MTKVTHDDSESICIDQCPDDITSVFGILGLNNFKVSVFLFLIFIVLNCDVFVDKVMPKGYTDGRHPTTKGIVLQGVLIVLGYMIINVLVSGGII